MIIINKKFKISETSIEERKKIAKDALAISMLDAKEPTDDVKQLVEEYVIGNMEISEILKKVVSGYVNNKI